MENDVVFTEDGKIGEEKAVDSQLSEPSVKGAVDFSLDASKHADGDKVHEEVVETESTSTASEEVALSTDRNIEIDSTLGDNERDSNGVNEACKANEVVGEPCVAPNTEDAVANTTLLQSEEGHDKRQISAENMGEGKTNGLMDDGIAENQKDDVNGVLEPDSSDVTKMVDQPEQNPANGESNKLSYLEVLTSGDAQTLEADSKEEPIQQKLDCQKLPQSSRGEIDIERSKMAKNEDVTNPEIDSLNSVTLVESEDRHSADSYSPKGHIHGITPRIEDANTVMGSGANHRLESESDGDAQYKIDQDVTSYSGQQPEHCEKTGAIIKDDVVEGEKRLDSECVQVEKVDDENIEKEQNSVSTTADTVVDHSKKEFEPGTNLSPSAVDGSLNLEIAETKPLPGPSELSEESSTSSQPQQANSNADVSRTINDGLGQEIVKEQEMETHLSGTGEPEVSSITSSSGSTSTSDHTSTHAANLRDAVMLQGSGLQDESSNVEKEMESVLGSSSSTAFSGTQSSGLKHTTTPQEPTPQSKEQRPPQGPTPESKEQRLRPATDAPSPNITASVQARPAGLGRAAPLPEPTSHHVQHPRVNGAVSAAQNQLIEEPTNGEVEEYDETREKLQMIRVKFLRLAHRLGQTPHNVVVAQVLYRLGLAEQLHGRSGGRVAAFSFDRASAMAEQLEAAGQEPLDFTCTIMVLGKSGVGKSATINSIFDEVMFGTDAFQVGTKKVQDVIGTVQGIRVRVIDTPGLLPSWSDQRQNEKILRSVKKFINKTAPDIVLYLDRLDMQSRDFGDMPLLRTITEIFGPSIWFNAIVVLTHAASAPPEGPNGTATSYDMFVTQRSHVVQQAIRQAAGDMRLMNPVSLVENHSACRTNRAGQRVLPNGQVWKPHLLLLSFASKILAEANTLLKLQETPPGRPFAPRTRSPPLPFLLSSLLQSRPEVKLPSEQFGDDDAMDDDLDDSSDSEEESEYDELPPFKPLTKAQLDKLTKAQRKSYYDELEYREKLFMKKQLKEEKKRRRVLKKMQEVAKDQPTDYNDNGEEEAGASASVPVPMPDLVLPASFDSDNPTHRYRSLDSSNPWLVRAVLEPNGWDHDIGYDGINVERLFVVKDRVPISFSGHVSKDKKDTNLQMELASSVKHGKGKATSMGFDMQSVGKDYAYTLRSETRLSNSRINKASAGFSATVLGDVVTGGLKVEDKLTIGKRGQIVVSGGTICGRGEVAYGGSLEATLRDKDHPLGRFLSTLGLSVMDWHGDLAIGCNSQTQIPIGRHTNLISRLNINNRGSGQFSVRVNSSEQLQIVLVSLIPLAQKLLYIFNKSSMDNASQ